MCKYSIIHEFDSAVSLWHACEVAGPLFLIWRTNNNNNNNNNNNEEKKTEENS